MSAPWIAAVFGLTGALIGATASVLTIWIQGRQETKRNRLRMIVDLAVSDQKTAMEFVKLGHGEVSPLPAIIYAYAKFLRLLEKGELTQENYQKLIEKNEEFRQFTMKVGKGDEGT